MVGGGGELMGQIDTRHQTVVGVQRNVEPSAVQRSEGMGGEIGEGTCLHVGSRGDFKRDTVIAHPTGKGTERDDLPVDHRRIFDDANPVADALSPADRQRPPDGVRAVALTAVDRQAEPALRSDPAGFQVVVCRIPGLGPCKIEGDDSAAGKAHCGSSDCRRIIHLAEGRDDRVQHRPGFGLCGSKAIENRCKGKGQWNVYDVVCVDGVVKLSVNGKFVNGVRKSSVKRGYLCLESEGAEIHFRNIRIMELPPGLAGKTNTATPVD